MPKTVRKNAKLYVSLGNIHHFKERIPMLR